VGHLRSIVIGVLGLGLIAGGVARSFSLVERTGAVDFRNRVVGARVAETGVNPYYFKWNPSYPETLLDPSDELNVRFSRVTSPPSTLWIHSLFADLPYTIQKWGNFAFSWLALFLAAGWIWYSLSSPLAPVLLGTGIFSFSALWMFHVERGQQYAYFTLFLVLVAFPAQSVLHSVSRAFLIFLRPTTGIAVFSVLREKNPKREFLITLALGLVFLLPVLLKYPLGWWLDYLASARDWYAHRWGLHEHINPFPGGIPYAFPLAPEGDPTLPGVWNFGARGSFFHHYAMKAGWMPSHGLGLILTAFLTTLSGWALWHSRNEPKIFFAARLFAAIYLTDYFLPAPRSGYNVALYFPGILLAIVRLSDSKWLKTGRKIRALLPEILISIGALFMLDAFFQPYGSPPHLEVFFVVGAALTLLRKPMSSV
jgi:hypothetical protein